MATNDSKKIKLHLSDDGVSNYINEKFVRPRLTPAQVGLIERTMDDSRHIMLGSADELLFLAQLCRLIGAKKTLDVGVYTGFSALTIALALPEDGKVIACDIDEKWPEIGRPFWKEAGVEGKISLRIAPALETLNSLVELEAGTFDFAFIDADKENYPNYYEVCLTLIRSGGIIAIDNALALGSVPDETVQNPRTVAIRRLNEIVANDERVDASLLNIADGVVVAFKK